MREKEKKYIVIVNDLQQKIDAKKIHPGDYLMSEKELGEYYQVSRDTVRKALNILAANGYIEKVTGKGSLVLDVNKIDFPVSGIKSFKEMATKYRVKLKQSCIRFKK